MTPTEIPHVCRLASAWRANHPECPGGVVLVYKKRVYGWKNALRDPEHERPGALAVDTADVVWRATGGNDYDGAKLWEKVNANR